MFPSTKFNERHRRCHGFSVEWPVAMDKEADFFPWILGAVIAATAAGAAVIASTHTTASTADKTPNQSAENVGAPTPIAPATLQVPPVVQPATRVRLGPGNVWECVVNGQRTFSDAPCGEHPVIRQLSAVNLIQSTPIPAAAPYISYDSGYSAAPVDQSGPDSVTQLYSNPPMILINERMRHRDSHRQGRPFHEGEKRN